MRKLEEGIKEHAFQDGAQIGNIVADRQEDGLGAPGHEDFLDALGQRGEGKLQLQLRERFLRRAELALAAVDQDEVRQ